jgi:hypothetical protein
MQTWKLTSLNVRAGHPEVLHSVLGEARSILLALPAGEQLHEHKVHEWSHLLVIEGDVIISDASRTNVSGGPGLLAVFDPAEVHEVRAESDARLLLILAPWPGAGHPGARR